MSTLWLALLVVSSGLLLILLLRNRFTWSLLKRFALHLVAAAIVLYVLNYSGLISGFYIPLNPATIATVVVLGIPGILLILGVQWMLL